MEASRASPSKQPSAAAAVLSSNTEQQQYSAAVLSSSSRQQYSQQRFHLSELPPEDRQKIFNFLLANQVDFNINADGEFEADLQIRAKDDSSGGSRVQLVAPSTRAPPSPSRLDALSLHNSSQTMLPEKLTETLRRATKPRTPVNPEITNLQNNYARKFPGFVALLPTLQQAPKLMSKAQVVKLIESLYKQRYKSEAAILEKQFVEGRKSVLMQNVQHVKNRTQQEEARALPFPRFVHEFTKKHYGVGKLSSPMLWALVKSIDRYREEDVCVQVFAMFLADTYDADDLLLFIHARHLAERIVLSKLNLGDWAPVQSKVIPPLHGTCLSKHEYLKLTASMLPGSFDSKKMMVSAETPPDVFTFLSELVRAYHVSRKGPITETPENAEHELQAAAETDAVPTDSLERQTTPPQLGLGVPSQGQETLLPDADVLLDGRVEQVADAGPIADAAPVADADPLADAGPIADAAPVADANLLTEAFQLPDEVAGPDAGETGEDVEEAVFEGAEEEEDYAEEYAEEAEEEAEDAAAGGAEEYAEEDAQAAADDDDPFGDVGF